MVFGVMAQLIFHIWTLYDHDWKQEDAEACEM